MKSFGESPQLTTTTAKILCNWWHLSMAIIYQKPKIQYFLGYDFCFSWIDARTPFVKIVIGSWSNITPAPTPII